MTSGNIITKSTTSEDPTPTENFRREVADGYGEGQELTNDRNNDPEDDDSEPEPDFQFLPRAGQVLPMSGGNRDGNIRSSKGDDKREEKRKARVAAEEKKKAEENKKSGEKK